MGKSSISGLVLVSIILLSINGCPSDELPGSTNDGISDQNNSSTVEFTQFTRLPFDIEYVSAVSPIGGFGGVNTRSNPYLGRPYGTERHFIWHMSPGTPYNVYAPATTYIISVRKTEGSGHYGLNFKIHYESYFRLDHIHILDPELESAIASQLGGTWEETSPFVSWPTPILVHEGDILGQTGVYTDSVNWDWFVEDRTRHEGVIAPDHYWSAIFAYSRSVYDLCTDEVKHQLASLAGEPGVPQKDSPILGQFGSDVPGTLSGTWFYDYTNAPRWGPKLAIFRPYHLDSSKIEIKLAIPELDLYGVWVVEPNTSGNVNPDPRTVTAEYGMVYYVLDDDYGSDESGVLMIQVNPNSTITIETYRDSFEPTEFNGFSGGELTLVR